MPQIAQLAATYSSQIFWVLITFGFVFFVIGLGMVPKVQSTVDARDKRISDDLATAKAAFARADEIEEEYRAKSNASRASAQQIALAAKDAATRDAAARLAAANAKTAEHVASAEARIEAASKAALTQVETIAAEAAQDMVSKLAGAAPSSDAALKAVKGALANG
mgnify:CR=1 FL=1